MRVSLIDVDSKIPNLALMKLSAYHKARGDVVGFNLSNPDRVYCSVVFNKNKKRFLNQQRLSRAEFVYGGSGVSLDSKLPTEIEFLRPDYALYPSSYSQGFTTRGCIRSCYFCVVPEKEGGLVRWQHPCEFVDLRFDTVLIMDNNWLADREWFFETSGWIVDQGLRVMEQGLDIRLVDHAVVSRLQELRIRIMHFAFDFTCLEPVVREKIRLLQECGVDTKNRCDFYVYCDSDEFFKDALYPCNVLRELGASAFLMFNCDSRKTGRVRDLMKWVNRKCLFWSVPFEKYSRLCHT